MAAKKTTFKEVTIDELIAPPNKEELLVKVKDLNIVFGKNASKNHAVKGVSLNIRKGEVLGLVGESGSGKTTIGRTIVGLQDRVSGEIDVDGIEIPMKISKINKAKRRKLAKTVQMIFQDPSSSLNPYKNIEKVVREGLDNVDVNQLFKKRYDDETIATLMKIMPKNKLPKSIKDKTMKEFSQMAIDEPDKLHDLIYKQIPKEIKNDKKARYYLEMRIERYEALINESGSSKKMKSKLVKDIVTSVGLSPAMLNRYPLEFSGGQQQRVGIARSVVLQPQLIVADEPISALDVSIQAQVINIFNDFKEKLSLTFLFIAHDLRMVEYISDRIAVINKGKIIEIGTSKEIVENPVHPYTRSLISSIPSINIINKSLKSIPYDYNSHDYSEVNVPSWFKFNKKAEHYVFGTKKEIAKWMEVKNENKGII